MTASVLIVDDDPRYLALLTARLETRDYNVAKASSAPDALRLIEDMRPDVVVSDILMPGMDGPALRRAVSGMSGRGSTPFVFVSAHRADGGTSTTPCLSKSAGVEAVLEQVEAKLGAFAATPQAAATMLAISTAGAGRKALWRTKTTGDTALVRALDITVAVLTLVALAPVMALLALMVRMSDGGPVFTIRCRVGSGGTTFNLRRFRATRIEARSMSDDCTHPDAATYLTGVGRFMRRFGLDALPQLVHVLTGKMSLTGPRPALPEEVADYGKREWRRLDARPGMTSTWRLDGVANMTAKDEIEADLDDLQQASMSRHIKLIMRTLLSCLTGRGR